MFARVNALFALKQAALSIPEEAIVPMGGKQFVIKAVPPDAVPEHGPLPADWCHNAPRSNSARAGQGVWKSSPV
jgi:hypothetical protein